MGDLPGHPFRGNQWTEAGQSGAIREQALSEWRRRESGQRDTQAGQESYTPPNRRLALEHVGVSMSRGDYLAEDRAPYGKWAVDASALPPVMHHYTDAKNVASIEANGLRPGAGAWGTAVYLTPETGYAAKGAKVDVQISPSARMVKFDDRADLEALYRNLGEDPSSISRGSVSGVLLKHGIQAAWVSSGKQLVVYDPKILSVSKGKSYPDRFGVPHATSWAADRATRSSNARDRGQRKLVRELRERRAKGLDKVRTPGDPFEGFRD